jgi:Tol biopolymer transport system component
VAWDTRTSEHKPIYSHPSANLYLASFSNDGRWAVFTSEEGAGAPHMWAAPFRGLQHVPLANWVDLGVGDYPRWSPGGGRIYFTQVHDGFECIFRDSRPMLRADRSLFVPKERRWTAAAVKHVCQVAFAAIMRDPVALGLKP